jgi:hypothetical protein
MLPENFQILIEKLIKIEFINKETEYEMNYLIKNENYKLLGDEQYQIFSNFEQEIYKIIFKQKENIVVESLKKNIVIEENSLKSIEIIISSKLGIEINDLKIDQIKEFFKSDNTIVQIFNGDLRKKFISFIKTNFNEENINQLDNIIHDRKKNLKSKKSHFLININNFENFKIEITEKNNCYLFNE